MKFYLNTLESPPFHGVSIDGETLDIASTQYEADLIVRKMVKIASGMRMKGKYVDFIIPEGKEALQLG